MFTNIHPNLLTQCVSLSRIHPYINVKSIKTPFHNINTDSKIEAKFQTNQLNSLSLVLCICNQKAGYKSFVIAMYY